MYLGRCNTNFLSEFISNFIFTHTKEVSYFSLTNVTYFSVYKIGAGKDARTEHYRIWNPKNRFQKKIPVESTALRRMNLDGFVIPICYVVTDNESVNHMMDGMCV